MSETTSLADPEVRTSRPRRQVRVVLDASVVVSALVFGGGAPAVLRHAWQRGRFTPLLSADTLLDLRARLSAPQLGLREGEQWRLLSEYVPYAHRVDVPLLGLPSAGGSVPPAVTYGRLAMAGRARAWVTADLELLALRSDALCPRYSIDAFAGLLLRRQRRPERSRETA